MVENGKKLDQELDSLRIHRSRRRSASSPSRWTARWILAGIVLVLAVSAAVTAFRLARQEIEVEVYRVVAGGQAGSEGTKVILNAAGYIVAPSQDSVDGQGGGKSRLDRRRKGRSGSGETGPGEIGGWPSIVLRPNRPRGNWPACWAQLSELEAGSRPEEIARANANLDRAKADLKNAKINLNRVRRLFEEEVLPRQDLDNAQARFEVEAAQVESLAREADLVRLGPREEQIEAMRGRVKQARGELALRQTFLDSTVIRAPITGTILERAVEKGEFVTTSFGGERGAKGYVVTLADLNDLQVELDISQDDFSKLSMNQQATIRTDAFPDRPYHGHIAEIAPEANRQKATVQVKVQVANPDAFLRPEMNAQVVFLAPEEPADENGAPSGVRITVPARGCPRAGGQQDGVRGLAGQGQRTACSGWRSERRGRGHHRGPDWRRRNRSQPARRSEGWRPNPSGGRLGKHLIE